MKMLVNTANQVFVDNFGIIRIHVVGNQIAESVSEMAEAASRLAIKRRKAGLPVILVDNLLQVGSVTAAGRRVVVDYGKKIDYDRLALLGKGALLRLGANLLIQAVGKGNLVRYFEDEQKALHWLLGTTKITP